MAGIRDDSAGGYGQWNNDDLSWLDYLKAKGSDIGGGAYNALANITGALSPIGTSPDGNMSLQVPPMISGIADSYSRLAGTPSQPGNAYSLTGVPEFDATPQQDMSNVLLSLYGGNAVSGLAKPKGALGAGPMKEAELPKSYRAYKGGQTANDDGQPFETIESRSGPWSGFYSSDPDVASRFTAPEHRANDGIFPVDITMENPHVIDANGKYAAQLQFHDYANGLPPADHRFRGAPWSQEWMDMILDPSKDGVILKNTADEGDVYVPTRRGSVKSATTGETLFSDTGKPSIFGGAAATAGEQPTYIPDWLKF